MERRPEGRLLLRHPPQNIRAGLYTLIRLRLRNVRAVLKVVLQNPRG
jgi:hypothetical protein